MSKKLTEAQKARRAWVRALRSGKYKQTTHCLHDKSEKGKEGFCCLGVLCELAVKKGIIPPALEEMNGVFTYDEHDTLLPDRVVAWAGLKSDSGGFYREIKGKDSLVALNDGGKKFKTIANIIESEPEGLFED